MSDKHSWTQNPVPHFGNEVEYILPKNPEREEYERLKEKYEGEKNERLKEKYEGEKNERLKEKYEGEKNE